MKVAHGILIGSLLTFGLPAPGRPDPPKRIGRVLLTFYWLIDESSPRYPHREDAELRSVRGAVIARTSRRFKRELLMEGTGWLRDGRTVSYDRRVSGESRFRVTTSMYGQGSTGCDLIPYRTVAVDPRLVRLGSRIFIPQLKGACLPDGTIHDGVFIANDRGQFRGAHIDVFVGAGSRAYLPFTRRGYGSRSHVTLDLLADPEAAGCEH